MTANAWRDGFFLGGGYDSVRGDPKQSAVVGVPAPPPLAEGQKGDTAFLRISTTAEFDQALSVGAELDVGFGLFGGGASFDYKTRCKVSSQATFVMVRIVAINPFTRLADPKLHPDAWELLKNNQHTRFLQRFGDRWVCGQTTGVQFFATARIEAMKAERQLELAAAIEASYGFFNKGEASVNFTEKMSSTEHKIEIVVQQLGGKVSFCGTVQEMFNNAKAALEDGRNGRAFPLSADTAPFTELEMPNDNVSGITSDFARRTVQTLSRSLQTLESQANDIQFVFAHKEWFEDFDNAALNKASRALANEINKIKNAADTCATDFGQCKLMVPEYPDFTLPLRKAEASRKPKTFEQEQARAQQVWGLEVEDKHNRPIAEILRRK
jgi:hypothetical protein